MRKIIVLLLFCNSSFAQNQWGLPIDSTTHLITYTEIIPVSGTQDELYSKAREWFASTYNSAQNVIQMDSKEDIIGKALMQVYYKGFPYGYIHYTISIYFKDGKYKYVVSNFYHEDEYNNAIPDYGLCEGMMNEKKKHDAKVCDVLLSTLDANTRDLISSLKESMNKSSVAKKESF